MFFSRLHKYKFLGLSGLLFHIQLVHTNSLLSDVRSGQVHQLHHGRLRLSKSQARSHLHVWISAARVFRRGNPWYSFLEQGRPSSVHQSLWCLYSVRHHDDIPLFVLVCVSDHCMLCGGTQSGVAL